MALASDGDRKARSANNWRSEASALTARLCSIRSGPFTTLAGQSGKSAKSWVSDAVVLSAGCASSSCRTAMPWIRKPVRPRITRPSWRAAGLRGSLRVGASSLTSANAATPAHTATWPASSRRGETPRSKSMRRLLARHRTMRSQYRFWIQPQAARSRRSLRRRFASSRAVRDAPTNRQC